jgi:hypothetical protein
MLLLPPPPLPPFKIMHAVARLRATMTLPNRLRVTSAMAASLDSCATLAACLF